MRNKNERSTNRIVRYEWRSGIARTTVNIAVASECIRHADSDGLLAHSETDTNTTRRRRRPLPLYSCCSVARMPSREGSMHERSREHISIFTIFLPVPVQACTSIESSQASSYVQILTSTSIKIISVNTQPEKKN